MVHPARIERATICLEGRCSIQLSYGCSRSRLDAEPGGRNPAAPLTNAAALSADFYRTATLAGSSPRSACFMQKRSKPRL